MTKEEMEQFRDNLNMVVEFVVMNSNGFDCDNNEHGLCYDDKDESFFIFYYSINGHPDVINDSDVHFWMKKFKNIIDENHFNPNNGEYNYLYQNAALNSYRELLMHEMGKLTPPQARIFGREFMLMTH